MIVIIIIIKGQAASEFGAPTKPDVIPGLFSDLALADSYT